MSLGGGFTSGKTLDPHILKHPQFDEMVGVIVVPLPSRVSRSTGAAHTVHIVVHPEAGDHTHASNK
jgi:hypothetical protein